VGHSALTRSSRETLGLWVTCRCPPWTREITDIATFPTFLSLALPGFEQFGIPLTANIICAIEQEVELER
jgi:hypothetical protein